MLKLGRYWPWKTVLSHFHMPVRPILLHRPSFLFDCSVKIFLGKWFTAPPWQKIARTPMLARTLWIFFFGKVHETFFNNSRAVLRGSSWSQSCQKFSSAWKIHQLCTRNKFSLHKMAHEFRAPRLRSRACARRKTREDIFNSFCPITAFFLFEKFTNIHNL